MNIGKLKIAIRGSKLPLLLIIITKVLSKSLCGKEQRVDGYSLCIINLNGLLEYFLKI